MEHNRIFIVSKSKGKTIIKLNYQQNNKFYRIYLILTTCGKIY